MTRLIDADVATNAAMRGADRWDGGCNSNRDLFIMEEMKAVPTVDAVPVVRCAECRHRDPEDHKCDCGAMERQGCPFLVDDDYFCKYGERKGGDAE